jgi:hypothetical protein
LPVAVFHDKAGAQFPNNPRRREAAGGHMRASKNLMTDKFAPSESHNESEIMSAPAQVGVSGDGDTEVGAALS